MRPVQEARRLQEDVGRYPDDQSFLEALLRLTTGLRDFHTLLCLPEPWARWMTVLSFQLHEYFDGSGAAHYLVGQLAPGAELGGDFVRGVEVTHWNGEPLARALHRLGKKGPAEIRLPWLLQEERPPGQTESLSFRSVKTPSGTFGYLRIASFMVGDVEGFVREVERIVRRLPETGLVIDVRGNPGGSIPASERLLQLFTPLRIEPAPFSFRCTDGGVGDGDRHPLPLYPRRCPPRGRRPAEAGR